MNKDIERDPGEEKKLDERLARMTGKSKEEYPSKQIWERQRELFRVQLLYPNEHVAYREHWEGEGDSLELVAVEVLCHSKDRGAVDEYLAKLSTEAFQNVCSTYVEPQRPSVSSPSR
jgi:hypothetical protein